MIFVGARLGFTSIGRIIVTIIAIYEFMIVLRVLLSWLHRLNILPASGVDRFLTAATEPVLGPVRQTLSRVGSFGGWDFSPVVAILLCELLQWIVKLIF